MEICTHTNTYTHLRHKFYIKNQTNTIPLVKQRQMKLQRKNLVCIRSPTDFKTTSQHSKVIKSFCSSQKLTARTLSEFRIIEDSWITTNIIKDHWSVLEPEIPFGAKSNWWMMERSEKGSWSSSQLSIIITIYKLIAVLPSYTRSNCSKKNAWIYGVKNLKSVRWVFTSWVLCFWNVTKFKFIPKEKLFWFLSQTCEQAYDTWVLVIRRKNLIETNLVHWIFTIQNTTFVFFWHLLQKEFLCLHAKRDYSSCQCSGS